MSKYLPLLLLLLFARSYQNNLPDSKLAKDVRTVVWPKLEKELISKGFKQYSPIYLVILKEDNLFQVWVKSKTTYKLFKTYGICFFSGGLGTKTRSGDGKSPEGFYTIGPKQLNPVSNYHLAINIGYPNKLEIKKGYSGNDIMVHGNCASIGCYAMTDPQIEEIYTLIYKAFDSGQQKIDLAVYPFRMDETHMKRYAGSAYFDFWKTIEPGYVFFEKHHLPPVISIRHNAYYISN